MFHQPNVTIILGIGYYRLSNFPLWCHLLEGAEQPFTTWTDNKNLTYLRNGKRLNACPAQRFLQGLNGSISYHPGSCNIKDALSCQFPPNTNHSEVCTILPPTCRIGYHNLGCRRHHQLRDRIGSRDWSGELVFLLCSCLLHSFTLDSFGKLLM